MGFGVLEKRLKAFKFIQFFKRIIHKRQKIKLSQLFQILVHLKQLLVP